MTDLDAFLYAIVASVSNIPEEYGWTEKLRKMNEEHGETE